MSREHGYRTAGAQATSKHWVAAVRGTCVELIGDGRTVERYGYDGYHTTQRRPWALRSESRKRNRMAKASRRANRPD